MNPFRLRNAVKVALPRFWKVIDLCRSVRLYPTVAVPFKGDKKKASWFGFGREELWREGLVFCLRCLAKHGF